MMNNENAYYYYTMEPVFLKDSQQTEAAEMTVTDNTFTFMPSDSTVRETLQSYTVHYVPHVSEQTSHREA